MQSITGSPLPIRHSPPSHSPASPESPQKLDTSPRNVLAAPACPAQGQQCCPSPEGSAGLLEQQGLCFTRPLPWEAPPPDQTLCSVLAHSQEKHFLENKLAEAVSACSAEISRPWGSGTGNSSLAQCPQGPCSALGCCGDPRPLGQACGAGLVPGAGPYAVLGATSKIVLREAVSVPAA